MECLTDQEVRSTIKFSGMFDKTYAQLTPIHELRHKLEWLYTTYPHTIPDYLLSKINSDPTHPMGNMISVVIRSTLLVYGMVLLKYAVDIMVNIMVDIGMVMKMYGQLYGQLLLYTGLFFIVVYLMSTSTEHTPRPHNTPGPTYKKQSISSTLKRKVWHTYIGQTMGQHKCLCCNLTYITQMSFHCGHIIPESKGGETILSNLLPICQNCNSSIGSKHMADFMKRFQ